MLPKKLIDKINQSVDDVYAKIKARFLGKEYQKKGIEFRVTNALEDFYRDIAQREGVTEPSEDNIETLKGVAESYLDASNAKAKAQVVNAVQSSIREAILTGDKRNIETALQGALSEVWGNATTHVHTILDSEINSTKNISIMDGVVQANAAVGVDDPVVFFVIVRDGNVCKECMRLHMMPDGITPRCWYLSEVGHGYHKKGEENPKIGGLHPHCFTGDMRIHTDKGMFTLKELYEAQIPVNVVVDNRIKNRKSPNNQYGKEVAGKVWLDRHARGTRILPATHVYDTGTQLCYRITFANGHTMDVSAGHDWWVDDGGAGIQKKTYELAIGDNIPVLSGEGGWGTVDIPDVAELMGNLMGDGAITKVSAHWNFFGNDIEYGKILNEKLKKVTGANVVFHEFEPDDKYSVPYARMSSNAFAKLIINEYKLSKKPRRVPEVIFKATKETVAAFLRGLYAADGHSENGSIVLAQNDKEFLKQVSQLLSNFGLSGRIYDHGKEESIKEITYRDGRKFQAKRKPCFRLVVSGYGQMVKFMEEIGFGVPAKNKRAKEILPNLKEANRHWIVASVTNIEPIGEQQTYCLTEPMTHTVSVNGLITGQCRCVFTTLLPNWGFNAAGRVTFIAPGYSEIKNQRGLGKSEMEYKPHNCDTCKTET